jgi:HK97 gp10 family phage protein
MGEYIDAQVDISDALRGLERLRSVRVSLARSMGVAGGQVFRDEAKLLAPVKDGVLRDSIYLAFRDARSTGDIVTYSITWNHSKAPHGHLIEFGHWQPFKVISLPDGSYVTTGVRLSAPKWTPAQPFLRPAYTGSLVRARNAMMERARERLPELLNGAAAGAGDEP